ncbi:MAG: hypothetical protein Aurels2KO_31910 [Aureliella sp.]
MPQSLDFVLDKFGTPPPEVALDWARQVVELAPQASSNESTDQHDTAAAGHDYNWSRFAVSASGTVTLPRTSDADDLSRLCFLHAAHLLRLSDGEPTTTEIPIRMTPRKLSDAIERRIEALKRKPVGDKTPVASQDRPAPPSRAKHSHRGRYAIATAGVCIVALGGWLVGSYLLSDFPNRDSLSSSENQPSVDQSIQERPQHNEDGSGSKLQTDSLALSSDLSADSATVDPEVAFDAPFVAPPVAADKLSQLGSVSRFDGARKDESVPETVPPPTGTTGKPTHSDDPPDHGEASASDLAAVDVAQELEKLQSPSDAESVTTIELTEDQHLELPALSVTVFPSLQSVDIKLPRSMRLRKPELELTMRVADGFTISPAGAIVASATQGAVWTVQADDDDSTSVVLVAAKLTTGRSPKIRIQITASSPDAPGVVVPLSRDYLERAETLLSGIRNRLTLGVAMLRRSQDTTPSELRGLLTQQRKAAEQQLEICEKLFKLTTDTRRIEGLLDGQFELHGSLHETAGANRKVVATFGQITTMSEQDAASPGQ